MTTRTLSLPTDTKTTGSLLLAMADFLNYKKAQGVAKLTMRDYNNTFMEFQRVTKNKLQCQALKVEVMEYFTLKTDGSPAKYNRPYGNLTAFFNWAVRQERLDKNPIKELELKKIRDDGNVRCVKVEAIKKMLAYPCISKRATAKPARRSDRRAGFRYFESSTYADRTRSRAARSPDTVVSDRCSNGVVNAYKL